MVKDPSGYLYFVHRRVVRIVKDRIKLRSLMNTLLHWGGDEEMPFTLTDRFLSFRYKENIEYNRYSRYIFSVSYFLVSCTLVYNLNGASTFLLGYLSKFP